MKGLRIGRRRGRDSDVALSPLELALKPALVDGRWQIPDRFNFTRDVVEALARDPKRRALTSLGNEGVIEHRNFHEIADGAAVWATTLRDAGINAGDRVMVVAGTTVDWLEIVLGTLKVGAVVVPCMPSVTSSMLERVVSSTDAALVVGEHSLEPTIAQMGFTPDVHLFQPGTKRNSKDVPEASTHDTASRDLAFVISTPGVGGTRKDVAHTHGSIFATRVQAEHWLDVGRGDAVWCTSDAASPLTMWNTVAGPWSRGAEVVLHDGAFEIDERLDLLFRLGPSILCQSPGEYAALAQHPKLERFRSPRLRRLVSTGDFLDPEVVAVFEERWGMTIYDGYGQAETNIVIANLADGAAQPGSIGRALPGHHVAIIDDQGNELPAGIEGDLAVRGRPPTLFAGYWELPEETKSAFLGDWYLTGDVAQVDEEGNFTFVGRAEDVITSSGRTFGPFEVERVLAGHDAIAAAAIVGIRDLQRGGHFVRAFVVPRGGLDGSEQLEAELRQYVAQMLPDQQVPREIVFVEELPIMSWKLSRHALRERPLAGRPLWELPPTSEPDMEATTPLPPPIDSEFSPRVDRGLDVPAPVAFVPEPEPAPEPVVFEPIQAIPEPVPFEPAPPPGEPVYVEPAPAPVEPEPVAPTPEPEPEPVADVVPVADPEPVVEPEPEPVVEVFAVPEAEPVAEALPVREPEPEPVVEPEPEPILEAVPAPEPVVEPEPEPVLEAVPAPEPVVEPEPVVASEPEPLAAEAEPEVDAPAEPTPEPPALVVVPQPEPLADPEPEPEHKPEFSVVDEPTSLPDYVVEESAAPTPVVVPEPEPEPELGPLPDFVVEPGSQPEPPPAPVESALEPEEEEDLGPLPDFVIDPSLPPELRPASPDPKPEIALKLTVELAPEPGADSTQPVSTELNFPSVTSFSISSSERRNDQGDPGDRRSSGRRSAPPDPGKAKRASQPAEPGDESSGNDWMAGLSNRLSAYSLSDESEVHDDDAKPTDADTVDESPDETAED
ncbi:MAG TPA: AMP-binding protein [Gaiellaceae bacterium]|nr:AMP-binding protein [Gaiellaceae bacterium]